MLRHRILECNQHTLPIDTGLELEGGTDLKRKLDLSMMALSSDAKNSFTVDVREAYISRGGFSFGERSVEWNRADEVWKLGFWSPRFVWDPLHPELIGKFGAFYHFESETGRATRESDPQANAEDLRAVA